MPKPAKGSRLGGGPAHERLMLANLTTALFEHKSITTTETKAKRMRPVAERMITFAKRGDLASRRRVLRTIRDKSVVHELFTNIAVTMEQRAGGYTRITKLGLRKGDRAPMVVIELVLEPVQTKTSVATKKTVSTKKVADKVDKKVVDKKVADKVDKKVVDKKVADKVDKKVVDKKVVEPETVSAVEDAVSDVPAVDVADKK